MSADIIGIGARLPERVMTNKEIEKIVDTSDEWIRARTGIRERRIISDEENVSDLAAGAAAAAIEAAGLSAKDIDLTIVASGSPEMIWPSTACLTQAKLGIIGPPAFDLQAACAGFVYGLAMADALIGSGAYKNVLLIGAEAMTRLLNWEDRGTCVLFGDGAGAVVLGPADPGYGILASHLASDGAAADILKIPAGGSRTPRGPRELHAINMKGNEVYKFAVQAMPKAVEGALEKAGLTSEDIDFCAPHQANWRIIESAAQRMGLPLEKIVGNLERFGNTSTASIPIALADLKESGRAKRGDVVVTAAVGAGLTWGANVIRLNGSGWEK